MLWLLTGLLTALFTALSQVGIKASRRHADEIVVLLAGTFSFLLLAPLALLLAGPPPFTWALVGWWVLSVTLNVGVAPFYVRALERSDLSIVGPLTALTPGFMLLTSPILVGESPPLLGMVGVLFLLAGTYLLYLDRSAAGWWGPLRALWNDPGGRIMLGVNLAWSVLANIDALGARGLGPLAWGALIQMSMCTVFLTAVLLRRSSLRLPARPRGWVLLALIPVATALMAASQLLTMTLTYASYSIALKRGSALLGILFGYWFFGERGGVGHRLAGAAFLLAGVALIVLG